MSFYYAENNEQKGPVSEAEFKQLLTQGRITGQTLVWQDGMAQWEPLEKVQERFPLPSGESSGLRLRPTGEKPSEATAVCSVTGKTHPKEEMIFHQGSWVHRSAQDSFFREMAAEKLTETAFIPAGFWIRLGAALIDGILLGITFSILGSLLVPILGEPSPDPDVFTQADGNHLIFNTILGIIYYTLMHGKFGATIGKLSVGIQVIRADGEPISYGRSAARYFAEILSALTLGIGYLMAAFDPQKRALHDHICKTRVIRR